MAWPGGVPAQHHELVISAIQWATLAYRSLASIKVNITLAQKAATITQPAAAVDASAATDSAVTPASAASAAGATEGTAGSAAEAITLQSLDKLAVFYSSEFDAQCLVFNAPHNMLVVAVRGTQTRENMLLDLAIRQVPFLAARPDVFVHDGFHDQFSAIQIQIDSRVATHFADGGNLLCCGHSLGAAVANLLAAHYGHSYPGRVAFIGFGTPRSGNIKFSELVDETTSLALCVKNQRDPVCEIVPALCLPHLYQHVGVEVCIGVDPMPDVADLYFLKDHHTAAYLKNLKALL